MTLALLQDSWGRRAVPLPFCSQTAEVQPPPALLSRGQLLPVLSAWDLHLKPNWRCPKWCSARGRGSQLLAAHMSQLEVNWPSPEESRSSDSNEFVLDEVGNHREEMTGRTTDAYLRWISETSAGSCTRLYVGVSDALTPHSLPEGQLAGAGPGVERSSVNLDAVTKRQRILVHHGSSCLEPANRSCETHGPSRLPGLFAEIHWL